MQDNGKIELLLSVYIIPIIMADNQKTVIYF